jgi:hypothetical protein
MRIAGAIVAAGATYALLAAPAGARWLGPEEVAPSRPISPPRIAINDGGDALIAWEEGRGMRVAYARDGGPFGRPRPIPGPQFHYTDIVPALAIDAGGNAVAAWADCRGRHRDRADGTVDCRSQIRVAVRRAGHPFRRARRVPHAPADDPRVAMRSGRAVIAWAGPQSIVAVRSDHGARLGTPRVIAHGNDVSDAAVGLDPAGRARLLFTGRGIEAVTWPLGRRPTRRRSLTESRPYYNFSAYTDRSGDQGIVWDSIEPSQVRAGLRAARHGFRSRVLARPRSNVLDSVALAGAPNGRYLAAFIRQPLGGNSSTQRPLLVSGRRPGGPFGRTRAVAGAETDTRPSAAVSAAGRRVLAWLVPGHGAIGTAVAPRGGGFRVSRSFALRKVDDYCDDTVRLCGPEMALDARGRGYLAWRDGRKIRYARFRP